MSSIQIICTYYNIHSQIDLVESITFLLIQPKNMVIIWTTKYLAFSTKFIGCLQQIFRQMEHLVDSTKYVFHSTKILFHSTKYSRMFNKTVSLVQFFFKHTIKVINTKNFLLEVRQYSNDRRRRNLLRNWPVPIVKVHYLRAENFNEKMTLLF